MANIFRLDQFKDLNKPVGSVSITGPGSSMSIPIKNTGYSLKIGDLLKVLISQLSPQLQSARVNMVDTSPISQSNILGLAKLKVRPDGAGYIDEEAGKIYVDVDKIVKHIMSGAFPPNVQLPSEGATLDPDLKKSIATKVWEAIAREIADTIAHEAHHKQRTLLNLKEGKPVDYNPEQEAIDAGRMVGKGISISPKL
jgi:hypothetical protein